MYYQDPERPVLKNVSFSVKAGMSVGIVGATGSGKTSTINLLPRFYPFQEGQILLDSVPIERIRRQHLRSKLGYVYQDTVLTRGSVRLNLRQLAGRPDLGDDELNAAATKTGLKHILDLNPQGFDLDVGESGVNLSMGERQLVALTGVILRNPRILILDEATAHINEEIEALVQHAVLEVMSGWTTFIIAHRLSTIRRCDLILVFDRGTICEQGTFEQLVATRGVFYQLVRYQQSCVQVDS
jgi:ATP-binding cassette subfamily B protein